MRRFRFRKRSRSAIANVAWRVTLAHRCWSRTCPHVIVYGSASMAPAAASFGAGDWPGASVSCSPHAPSSATAAHRAASVVVLVLSELIVYLLLAVITGPPW